jgi:hypothetical protein
LNTLLSSQTTHAHQTHPPRLRWGCTTIFRFQPSRSNSNRQIRAFLSTRCLAFRAYPVRPAVPNSRRISYQALHRLSALLSRGRSDLLFQRIRSNSQLQIGRFAQHSATIRSFTGWIRLLPAGRPLRTLARPTGVRLPCGLDESYARRPPSANPQRVMPATLGTETV